MSLSDWLNQNNCGNLLLFLQQNGINSIQELKDVGIDLLKSELSTPTFSQKYPNVSPQEKDNFLNAYRIGNFAPPPREEAPQEGGHNDPGPVNDNYNNMGGMEGGNKENDVVEVEVAPPQPYQMQNTYGNFQTSAPMYNTGQMPQGYPQQGVQEVPLYAQQGYNPNAPQYSPNQQLAPPNGYQQPQQQQVVVPPSGHYGYQPNGVYIAPPAPYCKECCHCSWTNIRKSNDNYGMLLMFVTPVILPLAMWLYSVDLNMASLFFYSWLWLYYFFSISECCGVRLKTYEDPQKKILCCCDCCNSFFGYIVWAYHVLTYVYIRIGMVTLILPMLTAIFCVCFCMLPAKRVFHNKGVYQPKVCPSCFDCFTKNFEGILLARYCCEVPE